MPVPLVGGQLFAWRLDEARHEATWNSGEGARINGGRWNSAGHAVVYLSADPAATSSELAGQQRFGDDLVQQHAFVAMPSAVSTRSWNEIFDPAVAIGMYVRHLQEPFALDTRLSPPVARA